MKKPPVLLCVSSRRVKLAVGRNVGSGFLVYAGSVASGVTAPSTPASALALRDALVAARVLVQSPGGSDALAFAQDFLFPSPSAAACVVLGMSANGQDVWRPMA